VQLTCVLQEASVLFINTHFPCSYILIESPSLLSLNVLTSHTSLTLAPPPPSTHPRLPPTPNPPSPERAANALIPTSGAAADCRRGASSAEGHWDLDSATPSALCAASPSSSTANHEVTLGFSWVGIGVFLGRDSGSLERDWGFVRSGINQYQSWENQKKSRNYAQLALIRSCLRA
jgi:hypothetical protein